MKHEGRPAGRLLLFAGVNCGFAFIDVLTGEPVIHRYSLSIARVLPTTLSGAPALPTSPVAIEGALTSMGGQRHARYAISLVGFESHSWRFEKVYS
ncbi:hypothetical protein [Dyella sp. A6]|uniref:hypothetical protein n=1 Tax=Dyella aluminiiresistens TaxID=3069105 RepID=UPI002E76C65B|nr:hypothetical protein [Dyella sp. A6]